MPNATWRHHAWRNRLQSLLLIAVLFGIAGLAGFLLAGAEGLWMALAASGLALAIQPLAAARLTLRLYRARPVAFDDAPQLCDLMAGIARRAGLPATPQLHYIPSTLVSAFAVGSPRHAAIALTDGLLRTLGMREIAGVLAHEAAHIAHGDLRVMNLADYVSRLTALFALAGQISLLLSLPWLLEGGAAINWIGLLLLAVSPQLALAAQMGLSRVREFDADLEAAHLTGDPEGLASALARIERISRDWRAWLLPGWGNPDPSWLRSHPPTEERIRRLLSLGRSPAADWPGAGAVTFGRVPVRRPPRWYPGGYWH
jgi:heat shock protein HtpX